MSEEISNDAMWLKRYARDSAAPLTSLVFILPMLIAYETALWALGPHAIRNGVEVWLRHGLAQIGFGQSLLLPLATCGILLAWHHLRGESCHVRTRTLLGMTAEAAALALALVALVHLQAELFRSSASAMTAVWSRNGYTIGQLLGFFGAGIYEELVFRLMLVPATVATLRGLGAPRAASLLGAVMVTSVVFSLAHYQIFSPYGDEFAWFTFLFRTAAGAIFAGLFLVRGFGVTAGAHAFYDIFIVMI